jgi:ADP-dependent NAD(P)H-hydrate dehydratase / NAD(P)H-hydrate epimerase
MSYAHPILSCEQALAFEKQLLKGDETCEWAAMQKAGKAVAASVLGDFQEIGGFDPEGSFLVLAGKGHNGGDALIAAQEILSRYPKAKADLVLAFPESELRPLALRALRECCEFGKRRVRQLSVTRLPASCCYELSLDGLFGFQFRRSLSAHVQALLKWESKCEVRLRAAVDLPSGLDSPGAYQADFSYATGIVKTPLLNCIHAGRLRYLDLGFFDQTAAKAHASHDFILTRKVLEPLRKLRPARCDKRSFGHLFILGGSRHDAGCRAHVGPGCAAQRCRFGDRLCARVARSRLRRAGTGSHVGRLAGDRKRQAWRLRASISCNIAGTAPRRCS